MRDRARRGVQDRLKLIPAAQRAGNTGLATVSTLAGFTVMMVLDVALG